jgi:hypothetical protein
MIDRRCYRLPLSVARASTVNINAEPFPDPDVARCRREVLTAAVISTLEFTLLRKPPKAGCSRSGATKVRHSHFVSRGSDASTPRHA